VEWASLVDRFYDFEAAWGYTDTGGGAITTTGRPKAMEHWLARARKWEKTVDIGVLGDTKSPGTFVSLWWDWWVKVQPTDRSDLAPLLRLHGKNGFLQVMALLLWWGERVADGNPADVREWSTAVEDVAEILLELLRPGLIAKLYVNSRLKLIRLLTDHDIQQKVVGKEHSRGIQGKEKKGCRWVSFRLNR
jgi:hypothetical protein